MDFIGSPNNVTVVTVTILQIKNKSFPFLCSIFKEKKAAIMRKKEQRRKQNFYKWWQKIINAHLKIVCFVLSQYKPLSSHKESTEEPLLKIYLVKISFYKRM